MKIVNAEFITSAVHPDGYPDTGLPEIAFLGRSNVGKSSLINNLVLRKKLAKTSSVPGKTQTINFYRVNDFVCLVDLPGYGYTHVPEHVSGKWRKFMDTYLQSREALAATVQLIDARHAPSAIDIRVYHWLAETELLGAVFAVKCDKLSRTRQIQSQAAIRSTLELPASIPLVMHSSLTGQGRDDAWQQICSLIQSNASENPGTDPLTGPLRSPGASGTP
ncbi:YihA family ribosome biogenesis GTP-binding protein [bacterium]|nr:YihA family ribosome biogenesis GTP-binding protein [candidate division CSSED10-310 bacterium]